MSIAADPKAQSGSKTGEEDATTSVGNRASGHLMMRAYNAGKLSPEVIKRKKEAEAEIAEVGRGHRFDEASACACLGHLTTLVLRTYLII